MIDTHTHSRWSHDGCEKITKMVKKAKDKKLQYLAITDHLDWDYLSITGYEYFDQLDLFGYLQEMEKIKEETEGLNFAIGLELGYQKKATSKYFEVIPFERFDYIINSVHTIGNHDVYFPSYFEGKEREESYRNYLLGIYESLDAPYPYCSIGHIGYLAKNSVYDKKIIEWGDFPDIIDSILKKIIEKDVSLEINSNIKNDICMPSKNILKRYREFGGEKITFGSDAHKLSRLCEGYKELSKLALSLGFKYWTVYQNLKPYSIKIL